MDMDSYYTYELESIAAAKSCDPAMKAAIEAELALREKDSERGPKVPTFAGPTLVESTQEQIDAELAMRKEDPKRGPQVPADKAPVLKESPRGEESKEPVVQERHGRSRSS